MQVRTAPSHSCVVRARRVGGVKSGVERWTASNRSDLKVHFAPYFSALISFVDRVLNFFTALVTGSAVPSA
jgi:hypothetical protein